LASRGFSRTLVLPTAVQSDKGEAAFKDGLLKLTILKAQEATTRQIKVKVSQVITLK
jgi:HSP20 family protein